MGRFGAPTACRPFSNNPLRPPKALHLEATPQIGTVVTTSSPLDIKPRQMMFERTLAHSEHIRSLTSQHLAHWAPAMSGKPSYLLYGAACLSLSEDCRVGILTP